MSFKCIHIADIHFRGLTRHDEYKLTFSRFFEQAREMCPDVIYVVGDIVHSKTQGISPELIDMLSWWFSVSGGRSRNTTLFVLLLSACF